MSEQVLTTLILAMQGIMVAIIGALAVRVGTVKGKVTAVQTDVSNVQSDVTKVKKDTAAALDQVANNHVDADGNPINMREENDSRHAETKAWMQDLKTSFSGQLRVVTKDIGGLRQEIRDDREEARSRFERMETRLDKS